MLVVKLNQIKNLAKEIERLEGLRKQIEKSPNAQFKKAFYENLKCCKAEFSKLSKDNLLDALDLSEEERKVAYLYFYKNMEWRDAMYNALSEKRLEKIYEDVTGKLETNIVNALKKQILKKVQVFYDYGKK